MTPRPKHEQEHLEAFREKWEGKVAPWLFAKMFMDECFKIDSGQLVITPYPENSKPEGNTTDE